MTDTDPLALADAGTPVADIVAATGLTTGKVYALLKQHRPNRPRTGRARTSELRLKILALGRVSPPKRVAKLLEGTCSRAYVYRCLAEVKT